MKNYRTIRGVITDKDTKEPMPFANICIYSGDSLIEKILSNMDGAYSIKIVAGKWKEINVRTSYVGYIMQVRQVKLEEEQSTIFSSQF